MSTNDDDPKQDRSTPTFLLLLIACLLADIGLEMAIYRSHIFWLKSPLLPWYFAALISQFGIFCAVRLRYPARRWFAYAGLLMVTVMGRLAIDTVDVLRLSERPLLAYLSAAILLALFCIAPGSLLQKRSQFPSDFTQFRIKHLLIFIVLIANGLAILPVLPQLIYLGTMVFFLALPTILMSFILSRTDSIHIYMNWVMALVVVVVFSFTLLINGPPSIYVLVGLPAFQIAIVAFGGGYLLMYPREPIPESKPLPNDNRPTDFG